jgi:hypothetical protein
MLISQRKKNVGMALVIGCVISGWVCEAGDTGPAVTVKIDPRVELMSIIFRLAGNPEYQQGRIIPYIQDVDRHFSGFKNHDAIKLASRLRETRGVSFDAVMGLAVHVKDASVLEEKVPFDPQPETLDSRWTPALAREFLSATRRFVADSGFREFLQVHNRLYELASRRLMAVMEKHGVVDWLDGFYGARPGSKFEIILGMLNGPGSYGARINPPDEEEVLYCILGVWDTDSRGDPRFTDMVLPTVVHEFCHSYCNPLVDRHLQELKSSGQEIFKRVDAAMRQMAYSNWMIMMRESLVRASVIRFLHVKFGEARATRGIQEERQRQFFWVGQLSALLGEYEQNRSVYPTLEEFFPRIIAFFNGYVHRIDQDAQNRETERRKKLEPLKARSPKIVAMMPPSGAQDVNPNLEAIVITFDRPMKDKQWAVMRLDGIFPKINGRIFYDKTRTILTIPVELHPDTSYKFGLNAEGYYGFVSQEGNPLYPVEVTLKTGKKRISGRPKAY